MQGERRGANSRAEPAVVSPDAGTTLVARGRELAHLNQLLDEARRGHAGICVLRGEPGVGKRRLLRLAIAEATGFSVVELSPIAEGERWEWPEPMAGLVSALAVPRTEERAPRGRAGATLSTRDVRAALAAGAIERLAVAASAPLLIALSESQHLEEPVLTALLDAVTIDLVNEPVVLLLSCTEVPGLEGISMPQVAHAEHHLGGLTLEQSRELLGLEGLEPEAPGVTRALHDATRGNPASLIDAAARLSDDQRTGHRDLPEPLVLGERVLEPFSPALDHLPSGCLTAVALVACARSSSELVAVALENLGLATTTLEPVIERGLVRRRGRRVELLHPLLGLAAYQRLGAAGRRELHEALSTAFLELGLPERAARHAASASPGPDRRVARLFGQAAQAADERGDARAAAQNHERAAEAAEGQEVADRHLVSAARHWTDLGEHGRALSLLGAMEGRDLDDVILSEASYQRVRARASQGALLADLVRETVAAADLCEEADPGRAAELLSDALARSHLGDLECGELVARIEALGPLAGAAGDVVDLVLDAVRRLHGWSSDGDGAPAALTTLLSGPLDVPLTSQMACVIGLGLLEGRDVGDVLRWNRWVERLGAATGDLALDAAPPLLDALACLSAGSFFEAAEHATRAFDAARRIGDDALAAEALGALVEVHVATGAYGPGFEQAARLFSLSTSTGLRTRAKAFVGLSLLELQSGRPTASLSWLQALGDDVERSAHHLIALDGLSRDGGWGAEVAAALVMVDATIELVERLTVSAKGSGGPEPASSWASAALGGDLALAASRLGEVLASASTPPFLRARCALCLGVVQARAGDVAGARRHLEEASDGFEALGALGWRGLAERERHELAKVRRSAAVAGSIESETSEPTGADGADDVLWEIRLLGGFSVQTQGKRVTLPHSLSAQTLKIVALRRSISVDELVEHLWPDAEPGVGNRRLRNVLWRVKSTCGDLLVREDGLLCLAPGTITDVATFRRKAEKALDPEVPPDRALTFAREATRCYHGELLPGDRYADWAETARETLRQLHLHVLEMLLDDAERHRRFPEASLLIERLLEEDPYNETIYVRAAELHAGTGSQPAAASMVRRADRMLAEIGAAPSSSLDRVRQSLAG